MIDAIPGDDQLFNALQARIRGRVPGFKVAYKNESRRQKILGKLAFFNPGYMTDCVSTYGATVWYPSKEFVEEDKMRAFRILGHEYVHLLDNKKHPVIFELLYVFPQWLILGALLAFLSFWFGLWWLTSLVALLALLPWPAFGRANLEMRAYAMNLAISMWRHGTTLQSSEDRIVSCFTGWMYYKMWPFEETVREWIEEYKRYIINVDAIRIPIDEVIFEHSEAYRDVYELLTGVEYE